MLQAIALLIIINSMSNAATSPGGDTTKTLWFIVHLICAVVVIRYWGQ